MDINISGILIETDRLILRQWEESDLDDFYEYASVEGVGEMAGWPHHTCKDTSLKILATFIADKNVFAVVYKASNKVIGSLGIHNSWAESDDKYSHLKTKQLGYVLSKDYWGHGLMPEAVKAVMDFIFNNYDLDAITCGHYSINNQSRRVIEKSGFVFVSKSEYYSKQLQKSFDSMKYIFMRPLG